MFNSVLQANRHIQSWSYIYSTFFFHGILAKSHFVAYFKSSVVASYHILCFSIDITITAANLHIVWCFINCFRLWKAEVSRFSQLKNTIKRNGNELEWFNWITNKVSITPALCSKLNHLWHFIQIKPWAVLQITS